eukprot:gene30266-52377_t
MGGTAEIADFALLLEYVSDIPGIERIRYTTSHPNEFTPRLIEAYAKLPKLASHLHLPVQHGSDRILMAMKRGYTAMEYKSTVRKLRAIRPDLAMSSDFIVGFPGETEDDFNKMMKLIDDIHFDNSFSFIFSPRPGTPAAGLHDDTPHDVKLRRLQEQDIANQLQSESLSPAQERKYKKLKDDIVADVKSLSLNQARIDALVEQLYDINKRLMGYEGRLMRLSESYGVDRTDFLKTYQGAELDPKW